MGPVSRSSRVKLLPYSGSPDQVSAGLPAPCTRHTGMVHAEMQKCLWENNTVTLCHLGLTKVYSHPEKKHLWVGPFSHFPLYLIHEKDVYFTYNIPLKSSPFSISAGWRTLITIGWILITITTYMGFYPSLLISCFHFCSSNLFWTLQQEVLLNTLCGSYLPGLNPFSAFLLHSMASELFAWPTRPLRPGPSFSIQESA